MTFCFRLEQRSTEWEQKLLRSEQETEDNKPSALNQQSNKHQLNFGLSYFVFHRKEWHRELWGSWLEVVDRSHHMPNPRQRQPSRRHRCERYYLHWRRELIRRRMSQKAASLWSRPLLVCGGSLDRRGGNAEVPWKTFPPTDVTAAYHSAGSSRRDE